MKLSNVHSYPPPSIYAQALNVADPQGRTPLHVAAINRVPPNNPGLDTSSANYDCAHDYISPMTVESRWRVRVLLWGLSDAFRDRSSFAAEHFAMFNCMLLGQQQQPHYVVRVCVCVCVCSVFADMCKVLFVNDTAHSAMFVRLPLARHPCCICIANVYFCPSPSTTPFCPQKIAEHGDKVTAITSTAQGRLRLHLASRQRLAQGLVHVMLGRGDQMGRTPVWYAIHTRAGGDVVLDLLRSGCSHVVTKASVGREGVGYCSKEEGEDTVHNTSIEGIFLFIYSEK